LIVVDASVLVKALVEQSRTGEQVRARLRGELLLAPAHIDAELLSVLRGLSRASKLRVASARQALDLVARMPLQRAPLPGYLPRAWELRDNYTAYDALCVALAESVDSPLLTADARLAGGVGARCAIEVIS
jgi:predicted nucleic acid-binding protein